MPNSSDVDAAWALGVSIFTLICVIIVTSIFYYQYSSFRNKTNSSLKSVVSQINDINKLNFNINTIQDDNMKSLHSHVHTL